MRWRWPRGGAYAAATSAHVPTRARSRVPFPSDVPQERRRVIRRRWGCCERLTGPDAVVRNIPRSGCKRHPFMRTKPGPEHPHRQTPRRCVAYPEHMTPPSDASPVRQVRPKTEGWSQKKDAEGRPLLQFASPKRGKPPVHLADLTPDERVTKVKELGLPGFRAKQLEKHYFTHWTHNPADMTDLPAEGRDDFVHGMLPPLLTEVRRLETDRGDTIKFLWKLHDGALVESVLMRYPGRITLCVSSQAGCGMNCPFCATGQAGLTRNMSAAEIVEQIVRANRLIADGGLGDPRRVGHEGE